MRWDSGVARWGRPAETLSEIHAPDIDAEGFRRRYVDTAQPVVLRGATRHWRAAERWSDPAYLAKRLAGQTFRFHREPVIEMRWRERHWPRRFGHVFDGQSSETLSFAEFARLARGDATIFAYAVGLDDDGLAALRDDVGGFAFVSRPGPPNYYRPLRAFMHGISYTDWHYHPDDSTLMCQFGRRKTVHLLPPDQSTWDVITSVAEHRDLIGPASASDFPQLTELRPYVATVETGDALYIPPNWWHAVQCDTRCERVGLTLARCWASPLHLRLDPRWPFHRFYQRHGPIKRRVQLVAAGLAWRLMAVAGGTLPEIPAMADTR